MVADLSTARHPSEADLTCSTVGFPRFATEGLATVRRPPDRRARALGHDSGRVDVALHDVVVPLDLLEVDGLAEARRLEEVARVAPQRGQRGQRAAVALEVRVVDGVEADQRREQPYVGLRERGAHQVAALGQTVL